MKLHDLNPATETKKASKRVGRGMGSGAGKTCGRGHNGQKSRSGYSRKRGFEGGQMPLIRRIPKRGFTNIFKTEYTIINIDQLNKFKNGSKVTIDDMLNCRVARKLQDGIKILGNGEATKKLTVQCNKISNSAKSKIESAGGKVEVI